MIGSRSGWGPRLLPPGRDDAACFLPWVLALMAYVAMLSGVGIVALHGTLRAAEQSLAGALTVQVPADASSLRLETIVAVLRRTPGVNSLHLFEPGETKRLLEPWLGPNVPLDELPVPRLIAVEIDPAATPDLATLRRQLSSVLPDARLDDHRTVFDAMRSAGRWTEAVLATAIAVALLLTGLLAVFAVRAALMVKQSEVEVLHLLGTPDAAVARQLERRYLGLGLIGGAVGASAALLTIVALGGAGALVQLPAPAMPRGIADWRLWTILAGGVIAAGLIPMGCARAAVLRWLARMP